MTRTDLQLLDGPGRMQTYKYLKHLGPNRPRSVQSDPYLRVCTTLLMMFNLETLGDRRRMMANAFASRLCNIQDDDTATDRQKAQARNTQKAMETWISFRRLVATVRAPEGKKNF